MDETLKTRVLDACALAAFFDGDPQAPRVARLFEKAHLEGQTLLMSSVNWCETLVPYVKIHGPGAIFRMDRKIESLPLRILDEDRWTSTEAAKLKGQYGLSLGDSYAAATAMKHQAALITFDPDFKVVSSQIEIEWLS